jgi:hypothetical protein
LQNSYCNRNLKLKTELKGERKMKDLIALISKSLVNRPEQVDVKEITGESAIIVELRVAKEDLGKVIGRQGATANAMRTILNAASARIPKRSTLEIIEC